MGFADRWATCMCLAMAFVCTAAGAQQPPPHPDAGKTAYYCDRNGSIGWQAEPCREGHRQLNTGRVRDNGTIQEDNAPPPVDVRSDAQRTPQAEPAPVQTASARAASPSPVGSHRLGYIKNPWAWLLGFALAFGLVAKLLGRSFTRWAVLGALTEFILVGLDMMPVK